MDYYKSVNRYTRISKENWIINELKMDFEFLFETIKSILIHPVDAKKVKYDRKNKGIFHCANSTVDKIFTYERLEVFLCKKQIPLPTTPNDRAVLSCDHHSLMLVSFLRSLGVPARARTGYSTYIVNGLTIPHWITEVYDDKRAEWIIMDSERKVKNVDRQLFLFAPQVWQLHMKTGRGFPSYSGFSGKQGLKYALLCDLNCIFKNELLSYEWRLKAHNRKKPDLVRTSYEKQSEKKREDINRIAKLMLNPDKNMDELWEIYKTIVENQDIESSNYK